MKNNLLLLCAALALTSTVHAQDRALDPARFYANKAIQDLAPGAFAVQASAVPMLEALERIAPAHRNALVAAIRGDAALSAEIAAWPTIGWPRQLAAIRTIMQLECAAMNAEVPPLVVHGPDET